MPSCEELRVALGLASRSAASKLLDRLEHRGAIKRIPGCARAIAIKNRKCPHCGKELKGPR
jgi:SOS-response transcriptional repressor LexA